MLYRGRNQESEPPGKHSGKKKLPSTGGNPRAGPSESETEQKNKRERSKDNKQSSTAGLLTVLNLTTSEFIPDL